MPRHRAVVVALAGVAIALAACGAGPTTTTSAPTTTAAPSPTAAITSDWKAFFSGTTSAQTKISLLENGTQFRSVIDAQTSSSLAKGASAKVKKVKLVSDTEATVTYTVLLDGVAALSNQTGTAVLQGGTWKVGSASFCGLLGLEGVKTAACSG